MKATVVIGIVAASLWVPASGRAQTPPPAADSPVTVNPGAAPAEVPGTAPAAPTGATAVPPVGTAGAAPTANAAPVVPTREMAVSSLVEKDLVGPGGEELGDIERVVEGTSDQKKYLVVSSGGVLGFFEDEVVVPLERVVVQNDRIATRDLTQDQLKAMPEFEAERYRELGESQRVAIVERK